MARSSRVPRSPSSSFSGSKSSTSLFFLRSFRTCPVHTQSIPRFTHKQFFASCFGSHTNHCLKSFPVHTQTIISNPAFSRKHSYFQVQHLPLLLPQLPNLVPTKRLFQSAPGSHKNIISDPVYTHDKNSWFHSNLPWFTHKPSTQILPRFTRKELFPDPAPPSSPAASAPARFTHTQLFRFLIRFKHESLFQIPPRFTHKPLSFILPRKTHNHHFKSCHDSHKNSNFQTQHLLSSSSNQSFGVNRCRI